MATVDLSCTDISLRLRLVFQSFICHSEQNLLQYQSEQLLTEEAAKARDNILKVLLANAELIQNRKQLPFSCHICGNVKDKSHVFFYPTAWFELFFAGH